MGNDGGTSSSTTLPSEFIRQQVAHLRTDLTTMEVRLKAHIDNQMDRLRQDLFARLDEMGKLVKNGAGKTEHSPDKAE